MQLPEFKFIAYSGTGLETFREQAYELNGKVWYKKNSRFYLPNVYYTTDLAEAIYYARTSHLNPLVLYGRLPIYRWLELPPRRVRIFPVDAVLVPTLPLPEEKFPDYVFSADGSRKRMDYSHYFEPMEAHQILGINPQHYQIQPP